jgi:GntR family transcriptional regulator/MocR family aminotransferase
MPKRTSTHDLVLHERPTGMSVAHWVYHELREAILAGRLPPGARLPSSRDVARQWQMARSTVVIAFEQLRAEGYVHGTVGAGTVVAATLPEERLQVGVRQAATPASLPSLAVLSQRGQRLVTSPFPRHAPADIGHPFRAGQPALDVFPWTLWSRLAARVQRQASRLALAHGDAQGYVPLREAIATYLGTARGVQCTATQVVIVSGTQLALDLVARLVLDPGETVWIEDPGCPGARRILEAVGAQLVPVPVDTAGLDVTAGHTLAPHAKLAYVTPARQCPLGMPMSLERRLALLRWAREANSWIFEDDYDSEYRYHGRPLAALQGLDPSGGVIYAGNFSKVLFPALRLAYVVLPPRLVEAFVAAHSLVDRYAPVLDQAVLAAFMSEGHFARHIRRMRTLYAERLQAFIKATHATCDDLLHVVDVAAGLDTIGWLSGGVDAQHITTRAAAQGLDVRPLSAYVLHRRQPPWLVLGFAPVPAPTMPQAVQRLAEVIRAARSHRRHEAMVF